MAWYMHITALQCHFRLHKSKEENNRRTKMVTNPPIGDGHRNGAVRRRSQTFNQQNNGLRETKKRAALWMSNRMELHSKEFVKNTKFRGRPKRTPSFLFGLL